MVLELEFLGLIFIVLVPEETAYVGSIVLPYPLVYCCAVPLMHSWALVVTASEHPWAVLEELLEEGVASLF